MGIPTSRISKKAVRRQNTTNRLAAAPKLDAAGQLAALDARLGKDIGAMKERKRLTAMLAKSA